ncbi:MBL fold metallo-hydrolase [Paenibacillus thiaminolyticus]|uniref:MBL fold metallo-hydrolase n=1 Tax=Paenibacillus thiaminolyticus TaxID=49283 RepID=UPI0035A596E3
MTDQSMQLPGFPHNEEGSAEGYDRGWTVTFWGTGDSMGVPRVYCACPVCEEARKEGVNRRYRSSVLLERGEERLLVDCGPDWTGQMERAGLYWLDDILITHAHQDHIAGLTAYADACRWLKRKGRATMPPEVGEMIRTMYPWLERYIEFQYIEGPWRWKDWSIQPIRVNHGKNGYSYAYRFDLGSSGRPAGENKPEVHSWLYASDAIGLGEQELAWFRGLDLLILGTNFVHEEAPYETRSVYDMREAVEVLGEVKPRKTVFTHLSHGVDLREDYPQLPASVTLARTGLVIPLQ